jgi:signal transduction histidine kinase
VQRTIIISIIILVIVNCIIVIVSTILLLRKILGQALGNLSKGIVSIASGNYASIIPPVPQEDINRIVGGINILARKVSERESEIRHINEDLEKRIEERTCQLREAQIQITEKAHKAGMADIAISVIHNVGNVLTSLITSCHEISKILKQSKALGFVKASKLLKENRTGLSDFICNDPRGAKVVDYIIILSGELNEENNYIQKQINRIHEKAASIKEIINAQQSYASLSSYTEKMQLEIAVEDALDILQPSLQKHSVIYEKHFLKVPDVGLQKAKMLHVIINLVKNAVEAVQLLPTEKRRITISIDNDNVMVYCRIIDTGYGIKKELLEKIFNHGYTTKKEGHGFGLHSCANYMTEMNGRIYAESQGEGCGATFILCLPISK